MPYVVAEENTKCRGNRESDCSEAEEKRLQSWVKSEWWNERKSWTLYRRVHGPGVFLCLRERERERLLGMKFFPWRQCITRNGRSSLNESCIKLLSLIACGARFNTAFSVWEHNALHCIGRHQFSSSKIKSLFSKVLILHTNGEKWKGKTESNHKWNLIENLNLFKKIIWRKNW